MKKTLILALAAISLSSVNAVASNNSNLIKVSSVNPIEESTGTILLVTERGGRLMDNITGEMMDFENPANIILTDGGVIIYVTVTTPNKVIRIIKNVKN